MDAAVAPNVGSASHYNLHAILDVSTGEFVSADCDDGSVDGSGFPAFDSSFGVDDDAAIVLNDAELSHKTLDDNECINAPFG